jgi:two-component system OmpR family sensor kinase/two-component system sensor histidine kinase BaeS
MRRHFMRRIAIAFVAFFLFMFLIGAFAFGIFSRFGAGEGPRDHFVPFFPLVGIVLLLVGGVAAGRAVRRTAAPIADVMEAADRVAGGDYSARVEPRGTRETRRLGRAFNEMAERLATSEDRRRELLADVAHELRTPLSVIRGNVEGMLDAVYEPDHAHLRPLLEETTVMARLLDDLQTLSTAEAGALRLHREPVDPAVLVEDSVAAFGARADEGGMRITWRADPDIGTVDADPIRLGEVLANLVSNAVRHTPTGGEVTVEARRDDDDVVFEVTDTGPGIAPEDLPHVFDRFVRSADSGGTGLGLAIAKRLVEAHDGRIEARSDASGTTVRFVLPAG